MGRLLRTASVRRWTRPTLAADISGRGGFVKLTEGSRGRGLSDRVATKGWSLKSAAKPRPHPQATGLLDTDRRVGRLWLYVLVTPWILSNHMPGILLTRFSKKG